MEFRFVHAADLHIDSPLAGLGLKDPVVADRFARASRAAVEGLIDATLQSKAAFLVVAGDVFDGDWKDVGTGLFFAQALGQLHRAGIPTVIVRGNHDADSIMSRQLPYPPSVHSFPSDRAATIAFDELRVALHGRSFSSRRTGDGFVNSYPARREGWLNIGVLHTGLDGSRGHETYAPCTVDDLRRFGYDYWALGHIHAGEIVSRDPWVVYPGNIQGRSVRETGAKGAMLVEVADGRIAEAKPIVLDAARWAHETVDVSQFHDAPEVLNAIGARLERLRRDSGALLVARREAIEDEARAIGVAIAADCWVERIKLATTPPPALFAPAGEPDALDIGGLIAAAAQDPEYQNSLSQVIAAIVDKMPRDLRAEFRADDPETLATIAALARDRLTGELAS
jgi:exonuclease SbcD